jgi:hypothetical protein
MYLDDPAAIAGYVLAIGATGTAVAAVVREGHSTSRRKQIAHLDELIKMRDRSRDLPAIRAGLESEIDALTYELWGTHERFADRPVPVEAVKRQRRRRLLRKLAPAFVFVAGLAAVLLVGAFAPTVAALIVAGVTVAAAAGSFAGDQLANPKVIDGEVVVPELPAGPAPKWDVQLDDATRRKRERIKAKAPRIHISDDNRSATP